MLKSSRSVRCIFVPKRNASHHYDLNHHLALVAPLTRLLPEVPKFLPRPPWCLWRLIWCYRLRLVGACSSVPVKSPREWQCRFAWRARGDSHTSVSASPKEIIMMLNEVVSRGCIKCALVLRNNFRILYWTPFTELFQLLTIILKIKHGVIVILSNSSFLSKSSGC